MKFSKQLFLEVAPLEISKRVPKNDLKKMDGREVIERSNGNLVIRNPSPGLMGPFWLIVKLEWCEE